MNRFILSAAAAAAMLLTACSSKTHPEQLDMPYCDGNFSSMVELTGVSRTDSNTVMTFLASNTPGWFEVDISKDAYLTTGNNRLPIIGSEGIEPGTTLHLKEGVPSEFKLVFPPLPKSATSVDFVDPIESRLRICIWGIDLTGERPVDGVPSDIPAELLTNDLSGKIPAASLDTGEATIHIHLAAYRPWISPEGRVIINHPNGRQQQLPFTADKNGNATVKVQLAGTTNVTIMTGSNVWSATYVDPGEELNFYVMPTNNSESQRMRLNAYSDGKYRMVPELEEKAVHFILQAEADFSGRELYQRFDRDQFFAGALRADSLLRDSIAKAEAEPMVRDWMLALADRVLLAHLSNPVQYAIGEWADVKGNEPKIEFTPEQIALAMARVNFDAPEMMITGKRIFNDQTAWPEGSLPFKLATFKRISRRSIEQDSLSDADADTLRSLGDPYYLKAAELLLQAEKDPAAGRFVG